LPVYSSAGPFLVQRPLSPPKISLLEKQETRPFRKIFPWFPGISQSISYWAFLFLMDGFSNSKKNSEHNEKDRQDNPFSNKEETHKNKHGVQEQKKGIAR
jgi:hypothetical protein